MLLIPFGILWFGYAVGLYGYTNLLGPGMGFADLILPSRIDKANKIWAALGTPAWVQPGQVRQPGTGAAGEPIFGTPPNPVTGTWPSGVAPAPGTAGSGGGAP